MTERGVGGIETQPENGKVARIESGTLQSRAGATQVVCGQAGRLLVSPTPAKSSVWVSKRLWVNPFRFDSGGLPPRRTQDASARCVNAGNGKVA